MPKTRQSWPTITIFKSPKHPRHNGPTTPTRKHSLPNGNPPAGTRPFSRRKPINSHHKVRHPNTPHTTAAVFTKHSHYQSLGQHASIFQLIKMYPEFHHRLTQSDIYFVYRGLAANANMALAIDHAIAKEREKISLDPGNTLGLFLIQERIKTALLHLGGRVTRFLEIQYAHKRITTPSFDKNASSNEAEKSQFQNNSLCKLYSLIATFLRLVTLYDKAISARKEQKNTDPLFQYFLKDLENQLSSTAVTAIPFQEPQNG